MKSQTIAEKIADQFEEDGEIFENKRGDDLIEVLLDHDPHPTTKDDNTRYVFDDDSAITISSGCWDIGYSCCYGWQNNRHHDECESNMPKIDYSEPDWSTIPEKEKISFDAWGAKSLSLDYPEFAQRTNENAERGLPEIVAKAIAQRNKLHVLTVRHDCTSLSKNEPSEELYQSTLGVPCDGGGWTPEAEIWFSIPCTEDDH